jgi:hypothetical protein
MTPALDGTVPPPRTDEPVLADHTTASLFAFMRKQVVGAASLVWTAAAVVAFGALTAAVSLDRWVAGSAIYPVLAAALLSEAYIIGSGLAPLAWRHVRPMLERVGWQPVTVTVLAERGTVLALPDGNRVRVWMLTPALRDVIARTGQVWLAGPDERGWLAVRVPGVHVPWPARIVPGSDGQSVVVVGADTDPAADQLRQLGRRQAVSLVAWAGLALVVGLTRVIGSPVLDSDVLLAGLGVATALYRGACIVRYRQLAALRRGPWQRLAATVERTEVRRNLVADATGTVQLPSGERFAVVMKNADLNVLANLEKMGAVWLAGDPRSGEQHVLGFPGYPLIAKARLTAE